MIYSDLFEILQKGGREPRVLKEVLVDLKNKLLIFKVLFYDENICVLN